MNDVFLCLGGNLGDRMETLKKCRTMINKDCGKIIKASSIYETEAWGSESVNKFLNQAIQLHTKYNAPELMYRLLSIEKKLGRKRTEFKNSDRLIDIDILFFNNEIIKTKNVEVPHPRLHLRNFVLRPMLDLAPGLLHPVFKKTIRTLYKECKDKLQAKKYEPAKYICVEGNIGAGKTTLAKALAKDLKAAFIPEQFEKNDLLPLFYEDNDTFAFPLEYSFLLGRYQQINDAFKLKNKILVSDYCIYKCLWFAKLNLKRKDHLFFKKHFAAINKQLPKPDLIIYLDTTTENLKKNIRSRARDYEQGITAKYLESVAKQYAKGLKTIDASRVLRVPVKKYHSKLNEELIKTIKKHLTEI